MQGNPPSLASIYPLASASQYGVMAPPIPAPPVSQSKFDHDTMMAMFSMAFQAGQQNPGGPARSVSATPPVSFSAPVVMGPPLAPAPSIFTSILSRRATKGDQTTRGHSFASRGRSKTKKLRLGSSPISMSGPSTLSNVSTAAPQDSATAVDTLSSSTITSNASAGSPVAAPLFPVL